MITVSFSIKQHSQLHTPLSATHAVVRELATRRAAAEVGKMIEGEGFDALREGVSTTLTLSDRDVARFVSVPIGASNAYAMARSDQTIESLKLWGKPATELPRRYLLAALAQAAAGNTTALDGVDERAEIQVPEEEW